MTIRNIEVILKTTNIQIYRRALVKHYGVELLVANINDIRFHMESDIGGNLVLVESNKPYTLTEALAFEVWLATHIDVGQVILKQALLTQYGFNLTYGQCNIVDYINDLTDLYLWLHDNPTVDGYNYDFRECTLPVVKDALETMKIIDDGALRDCINDNDGAIDLYGPIDSIDGVVCKYTDWEQVCVFDEMYGTIFIPPQRVHSQYGDDIQSYFAQKQQAPVYLALDVSQINNVQRILHVLYSTYRLRGIQKLMSKLQGE